MITQDSDVFIENTLVQDDFVQSEHIENTQTSPIQNDFVQPESVAEETKQPESVVVAKTPETEP